MTTPHGTKAQQSISQALEVMKPQQVWNYKNEQIKLIVFNRREGIVKYFNLTTKRNGSMCVAWLHQHGTLEN